MKLHFDGEPDHLDRMRKLFPKTSTVQVRWAAADPRKLRISRISIALQQWKKKYGRAA